MIKDDIHSLPDDPAILRQMLIQQYQQIQLLQTENELKSRKIDTLQTTVELHVQTIARKAEANAN